MISIASFLGLLEFVDKMEQRELQLSSLDKIRHRFVTICQFQQKDLDVSCCVAQNMQFCRY